MYPFVTMADKGSQNKTAKVRKSSSQGSSASVNKNKRKYEKSPQGTVPTGRADLTSTDDTPANPGTHISMYLVLNPVAIELNHSTMYSQLDRTG